ncbi:prolyl oligopeptidase family serine peptidase [Streptomyces celluloflavus]|uniref:alpha/beta hydrolase family protein n=1 Tax=Streptomyces celluloflavus TaxID=58344 RepID=UPI003794F2B9
MLPTDVRDTAEYEAVHGYLLRSHEPAFGRPAALSEPHTSPDGRRIVVTGAVLDKLAGVPRTAVYAVEDGELRAITSGTASARYPRVSPDGRTLAFLSDRAQPGRFQLHLLHEGRMSEAEAAPTVPGTVEYAHWSPDGTRLLLGVAGLGADLSGGQGARKNVAQDGGLPEWHPAIDTGPGEASWRSLWLYTVATGELSRVSPEGMNCWEAGWCGPSRLAAVTSDAPAEDDWYGAVLTLIELGTGECRELLRSDVQLGWPAGSPDGRYVGVVEAVCSDRWLVAGELSVIDLRTGTRTAIDTAGTDVTCLQWLDADRLGYLGQRHLDSVTAIADVPHGKVTEVFSTGLSCGGLFYPEGTFTADGGVLVVQSAYRLPPRLALVAAGSERVLASTSHPGTDFLLSTCGNAEAVTWNSRDGLEIEGILCTPPGDGPHPLVVNVHGGPVWAYRDTWSMHAPYVPLLVSRGYAVFHPNPRGSGGRGQEFAGAVVGDMGGADALDILSGIDALVERGLADPDRIGLIGGSYGGFMSSWLVTQDQRFAASVPTAPVTDWCSQTFTSNIGGWGLAFLQADRDAPGAPAQDRSPVLHAGKVRTPCLNVAGAKDLCTPAGQAQEFHQALLAHGVESVLAVYPLEGHGIRMYPALTDYLTRVVMWFDRHMPARAGR